MIKTTKGKKVVRNTLLTGGVILASLFLSDNVKANIEEGDVSTQTNSELLDKFKQENKIKLSIKEIEEKGINEAKERYREASLKRSNAWLKAKERQRELARIEAERIAKLQAEEAERKRKEELARQQELQRQQELERKKRIEQQKKSVKAQSKASSKYKSSNKGQVYSVTFYTAGVESTGKRKGDKGYGITASGAYVQEGVTAACPKNIPLGTKVHIEGFGTRICQDRGSAIISGKLDIYVDSVSKARQLGRQNLRVTILK